MIVGLLTFSIGILWFVLSVALTIWWRNHWRYIYFGGPGARIQDWVTDFFIASVAAGCVCGIFYYPLDWLKRHNLTYFPDIIVLIGGVLWFINNRKKESESPENAQTSPMASIPKLCPNCGNELADDEIFCIKCGTKYEAQAVPVEVNNTASQTLQPNSKVCSKCGSVLDDDEVFCTKCGTKYEVPVVSEEVNDTSSNSKLCTKCGKKLADDEMFCCNCGTKYDA